LDYPVGMTNTLAYAVIRQSRNLVEVTIPVFVLDGPANASNRINL